MPQFMVGTEEVQQAGAKIQALSQQIEDLIADLQQTATAVHGSWTGNANSAFESAMSEWRSAAINIRTAANEIGMATTKAGGNYADAEAANTSMFG
jgi:6 kDa early secretory antigenic target